MTTPTPMETLKAKTSHWHNELEKHAQSRNIMDLSMSRDGFERLLVFQYALHQCIEPQIVPVLDEHWPALNYGAERQKLSALTSDLVKLKTDIHPPSVEAGFIQSPFHALGCAYVLEGSTLGGQVILRHLKQIPEIAVDEPFNYYALYGSEVGPRWKVFQELVNNAVDTEEKLTEITEAAVKTFTLACEIYESMAQQKAVPY